MTLNIASRLVLAACLPVVACAGPHIRPDDPAPVDMPFLLKFVEPEAGAMGLSPLRESELRSGFKEIRIWTGFGTTSPDAMLRLQIDHDGKVDGALVLHFRPAEDDADFNRHVRSDIRQMCDLPATAEDVDACIVNFANPPNWHRLFRELERLNVWTLPDESELPKPKYQMSDGSGMLVELREGKAYRAYEYINPGMIDAIAADRAGRIMELTGHLVSQLWDRLPNDQYTKSSPVILVVHRDQLRDTGTSDLS